VKQVRSGIGHAETYRRTLRALGIRHHQQEIVVPDSPTVRGMLHKVRHLVRVTREEA
jgi:large subunit ribosomal protein L30